MATSVRDTQTTQELLESGSVINVRDTQTTQELLESGATINVRDTQSTTELLESGLVLNVFETQVSQEVVVSAIPCPGPLPFEIQTPSLLLDEGQLALVRRIFVDANLNGQTLSPVACVDNVDNTLVNITNSARSTIEMDYQFSGRLFGLRLTGLLANRIEVFGVTLDIDYGMGADQ